MDQQNCEQELARAGKVHDELIRFKKEIILLKKNCLDETESVALKKVEEYTYYSEKVSNLTPLITSMVII